MRKVLEGKAKRDRSTLLLGPIFEKRGKEEGNRGGRGGHEKSISQFFSRGEQKRRRGGTMTEWGFSAPSPGGLLNIKTQGKNQSEEGHSYILRAEAKSFGLGDA